MTYFYVRKRKKITRRGQTNVSAPSFRGTRFKSVRGWNLARVPSIDRYYLVVSRDPLTSLRHADWHPNRRSGAVPHCGVHRRIFRVPPLILTPFLSCFLFPSRPPSLLCSSLSSLCSSFVRPPPPPPSRTSLRLDCRAFHVLSDCVPLTRILPRNYQEEELGKRYVVKRPDLNWKERIGVYRRNFMISTSERAIPRSKWFYPSRILRGQFNLKSTGTIR